MNCLVDIDEAQAEWVVTAFLAQDARMLDVVYANRDPHLRTGSMIAGAPEDFVIAESDLVGKLTDAEEIRLVRTKLPKMWGDVPISAYYMPRTMSIRQAGKKSNHGLNYNMQYKRFALETGMQEAEANRICSIYRNIAYPGLKNYYQDIENQLRRDGRRLTNCFGQSRVFLDRWGPDLLDAAYAFKPQSTVANIATRGWKDIYRDQELPRVEIRVHGHDSVTTHNSFDSIDELQFQIERCVKHMGTPFEYHGRSFTIRRTVKIGVCWGDGSMIDVKVSDEGLIDLDELTRAWELALAAPH